MSRCAIGGLIACALAIASTAGRNNAIASSSG